MIELPIEKKLSIVENEIQMLEKTLEDVKVDESRSVLEELLGQLKNEAEMLSHGLDCEPEISEPDNDEPEQTNVNVKFETLTDVSKYLNDKECEVTKEMSNTDRKLFVDGAKWFFGIAIKKEEKLKKVIKSLHNAISKYTEEINEYRELYDFNMAIKTTKRKTHKKHSIIEDDEDDYNQKNIYDVIDEMDDEQK